MDSRNQSGVYYPYYSIATWPDGEQARNGQQDRAREPTILRQRGGAPDGAATLTPPPPLSKIDYSVPPTGWVGGQKGARAPTIICLGGPLEPLLFARAPMMPLPYYGTRGAPTMALLPLWGRIAHRIVGGEALSILWERFAEIATSPSPLQWSGICPIELIGAPHPNAIE